MPITLEDWFPASPFTGPPLPKWMNMRWPWYKEVAAAPPAAPPVIVIPPEVVTPPEVVVPPVIIPPAKVYAIAVADEQGTDMNAGAWFFNDFRKIDLSYDGGGRYALGAPDGLPAYVRGSAGSYLILSFGTPIQAKTLRLYYMNQYTYIVSSLYRVDISLDRVNWVKVADGSTLGEAPVGATVYDIPVDQSIQFVRFYQEQTGVDMGVDAMEAVK